ncbi:MAG TPA: response regulator [Acidimicrobiales bacterium]|nr:response regulator [Acidimicrobiales bacterium]
MNGQTPAAILVTEDDAQHALLIRAALKAARLANPILVFDEGEQALAYLRGDGVYADRGLYPLPVLGLFDLHLPVMSGLDVLRGMREQPGLGHVPAVVLTASEDPADIDRAYSAGANSYLIKPVGFEALLEVVRNLGLHWVLTSDVTVEPA